MNPIPDDLSGGPAPQQALPIAPLLTALEPGLHNPEKAPAFFAALAAAQGEYGPLVRDKKVVQKLRDKVTRELTGQSITFWYADMAAVLEATRPALSKHGLSFSQPLITAPDGQLWIVNILAHSGGAMLVTKVPVPGGDDIKSFGTNLTYLRRYSAGPMLGISAEDDSDENGEPPEDDRDGGGYGRAQPPASSTRTRTPAASADSRPAAAPIQDVAPAKATRAQITMLNAKIKAAGIAPEQISAMLTGMGLPASLDDLLTSDYQRVKAEVEKMS